MDIKNTNVPLLKSELTILVEILDLGILKSENILKNKCPCMVKTTPTLFKFIMKNYEFTKKDPSTRTHFFNNINKMFDLIQDIQESKISQYDASVIIGKILAQQYLLV